MGYLALGIRCLIGAVFLASSVGKVTGHGAFDRFVSSVEGMRVLPARSARPVARCVVAAEFTVWAALAVPVTAVAVLGFVVAGGLLAVFATGILLSLRQGVRAACRCFGVTASPLGVRHVVRNLVLTALAITGAVAVPTAGGTTAGGAAVAVIGGLLAGGLVAALDDILDLFRPTGPLPEPALKS
ncbi:MauE/DoxX family redox-associated membrane protein [Streptomyces sp. UNOC14_S4]|uniref:MauE/DoxX family redox-associated membrane protein n=1 Tax=Streptomyces sp. UNOC14_S4 TaxID=2872340 RepID=UPI001E4BC11F|nr:MauE/DoxX family redox-associated membrane protein [Streptomyces sp. UNOC14_S4]MCC3769324.1 methylamine utilization protein MauE [Streptomyces sp. UNOC14_S4]